MNTPDGLKWTGLLSGWKSLDNKPRHKNKMLPGTIECYISFYK